MNLFFYGSNQALWRYLLEKSGLYQNAVMLFVLDKFDTHVTASSIAKGIEKSVVGTGKYSVV